MSIGAPIAALDVPTVLMLGLFFLVSVLIGAFAARAGRRATASEEARGAIVEEQAALRRVATLVARGLPLTEVFAAVADELGRLVSIDAVRLLRYEGDGSATMVSGGTEIAEGHVDLRTGARLTLEGKSVMALVLRTGRPARIDSYANIEGSTAAILRNAGFRSAVGTPIVVEGRLWGVMIAASRQPDPVPLEMESRLAEFTDLVATAIANAEARAELERLAAEQAALGRVATLVAEAVPSAEIFAAVTEEVGRLLHLDVAHMHVYNGDGTTTIVGTWSLRGTHFPVGTRLSLEGDDVAARAFRAQRPARVDDFADIEGKTAGYIRSFGIRSAAGTPIMVGGRPWGLMIAASQQPEPLPVDTESRIGAFMDLVATAISNAEARREVERVAAEQAALGRVATLVAGAVPSTEIFAAVATEIAGLIGVPLVGLFRYETDRTATVIAAAGDTPRYLGRVFSFLPDDPSVLAALLRTGRPARVDDYAGLRASDAEAVDELGLGEMVGVPVIADGRVWGGVIVGLAKGRAPLPENTFERLAALTELVATAIANAEARTEIGRLAEEQAALRRVATLVARGVQPVKVFAAVAEEIGRFLDADTTSVFRYEADATATIVAIWRDDSLSPVGSNWTLEGESVTAQVFRTRGSARMDGYSQATGEIATLARRLGRRSSVGAPIIIDDRLWGAAVAGSGSRPLPAAAEERIANFTELIGIAISNAEARSELTASRARVVAASDQTRRQLERDLHDGIQQRLVSLALKARAAQSMTPRPSDEVQGELSLLAEGLAGALDELRETSHGIHPAILSEAGLGPALKALARRSTVPIALDLHLDSRLDESLEVAAYYVTSEAITNALKHAQASVIEIHVDCLDGVLTLTIRDDGVGGADPNHGSGIIGLRDRVEALGGTISIVSPPGEGTTLHAHLPADPHAAPTPTPDAPSTPRTAWVTSEPAEPR